MLATMRDVVSTLLVILDNQFPASQARLYPDGSAGRAVHAHVRRAMTYLQQALYELRRATIKAQIDD